MIEHTQKDFETLISLENDYSIACDELYEALKQEKTASYALAVKEMTVRKELMEDLMLEKNSAAKNESIVKERILKEKIDLQLREFNRRMASVKHDQAKEKLYVYKKQLNF